MGKCYFIHFQGRQIGELQIYTEGLYYRIFCRCNLPGKEVYRLIAIGEKDEFDLGICLPEQGELILRKCIPVKCLHFEILGFELREHNTAVSERFIAVHQNEAFPHIDQLCGAKWRCHGEIMGVILKN